MSISRDLLQRLRGAACEEELPHAARAAIRDAVEALARGSGNEALAWPLYKSARDCARGLASASSVVALARAVARAGGLDLVTKDGARS